MCLCLAARSEKASAWFRSPAARVRSRAAPASDSTWNDFKTFIGTQDVCYSFLEECGCRELKIVKAKKRHVKECQRNQVIFYFRSLFFHYGLRPLPVRGPFAQSPAECFGTSSAPHLAFRTKRLNSKYMHWGEHWEDWDRDWKRRQKNAKDTMDMRKVASEEE